MCLHRKKLHLLSSFHDQALGIEKRWLFLQMVKNALRLLPVQDQTAQNVLKIIELYINKSVCV